MTRWAWKALKTGAAAAAAGFLLFVPSVTGAVDWAGVQGKDITLFYPGQASWEWALTPSNHSGATKFREGKDCTACHEGEQAQIGDLIVSGQKLEPNPIPGKRGSIPLNVKIVHDNDRIYFRLAWPGKGGSAAGGPGEKYMVTIMLDDGSVVEAVRAGCWGVCHDDANEMASAVAGQDLTKYLARSRTRVTRQGGGTNYKTDDEIAALASEGVFLEYLQARFAAGDEPTAVHGHILKAREEDKGAEVKATAAFQDGAWVVELSRPLKAWGRYTKEIVPGKTYPVGFAIHEGGVEGRHHYVSLGYSFVLDKGEADFVAVKK